MAVHVIKDLKKLRRGLGNLFDVTWVNIGADIGPSLELECFESTEIFNGARKLITFVFTRNWVRKLALFSTNKAV